MTGPTDESGTRSMSVHTVINAFSATFSASALFLFSRSVYCLSFSTHTPPLVSRILCQTSVSLTSRRRRDDPGNDLDDACADLVFLGRCSIIS